MPDNPPENTAEEAPDKKAEEKARQKGELATVEKLTAIGCTLEDMARVVGVSKRTLIRRKKEPRFLEAIERGHAQGHLSLHRALWKSAMGTDKTPGNVTAQIWLSKQMLGYRSFENEKKVVEEAPMPPYIVQVYEDPPEDTQPPAIAPPKKDT
jgi:DNA-binding XRE family transcriptional regulator